MAAVDSTCVTTDPTPPTSPGQEQVQECIDNTTSLGDPSADCGGASPTGTWIAITPAGSAPPTVSDMFDTTGLAGSTMGFRGHYVPDGSGYAQSASPGVDLTITAACSGATIAADNAGGSNTSAGTSGTWSFEIKVHACENLTAVSAQGGTNGWTSLTSYTPSTGDVTEKDNKKSQVLTWTIGSMSAEQDATLDVTVSGTIKPGTPSGTVLNLSGPWSAVYTDSNGTFKTDYTDEVTITVQ